VLSNALLSAELAAVQILSKTQPPAPGTQEVHAVTALIKTFERPYAVTRLVKSLRYRYPSIKVIVVDDSQSPQAIEGAQLVKLPFDSGVSAGRQAGLAQVTTPYTLLLDDDFVVHRGTRLEFPLETLQGTTNIDLVAGSVIDLPLLRRRTRRGGLWPSPARSLHEEGSLLAGLPVVLKPANFYLARTESLRRVGWDLQVKRLDHADFFTRALGKITCAQDDRWSVLHARNPFDDHYMAYRMDVAADRLYLAAKHGALNRGTAQDKASPE
jgi:glycosyltransferase involved in cell wall biosynthesis